jgi:type I restriction enzyme S subunit
MSFTADIDEIVAENRNRLLGAHPSWKRVRLREVAVLLNGFPFESAKFRKDKGTPLLRIRDVVRGQTETFYEGDFDPIFVIQPGELVVGMDGDFNSACWRGKPALLNQRVCKITTDPARYSAKFLEYVLPGYLAAINEHTPSVTVKHLSSRTIADIPLPDPPLDEQQHIVAEIEKQFTRLDAGASSLMRVQSALKRYRGTVLKAACAGRLALTEAELARKENRSSETGEELLQRILKQRRETWKGKGKYKEPATADLADLPRLPEGWAWARLEQLGFIFGGLTKNPKRSKLKKQLPYLRVANVYANDLRLDDIEYIGVEDSELAKLLVRAGDLLIVEGNGSKAQIGRLAIWGGAIDPCVHQNHLIKVRSIEPRMPKWILYWLQSPIGREFVELVASSTSGLYTLSVNKVGDLPIALPPLAEQQRIVAAIERRLSIIEQLEAVTSTELHRAVRLRQSILQRAFVNGGDSVQSHNVEA